MGAYESSLIGIQPKEVPPVRLYISDTGDDSNGSSWNTAIDSFEKGMTIIDNTDSRYEIWVKAGHYNFADVLLISPRVTIYGGFAGIEKELNERDPEKNKAIIDGQKKERGILNYGHINGVSIQNYDSTLRDGIILNKGILSNVEFYRNNIREFGVGIFNQRGLIHGCRIHENQNGCALLNEDGILNGVKVYGNSSPFSIIRNNFYGCIFNSIIYNNKTQNGQIVNNDGLAAHCTLYGNYAENIFEIASFRGFINSIIWKCNDSFQAVSINSCIEVPFKGSQNRNISSDPLFISTLNEKTYDFRLQNSSPCLVTNLDVDLKAAPLYIPPYLLEKMDLYLKKDIEGNPRSFPNGTVCMGAYESSLDPKAEIVPPVRRYISQQGDVSTGDSWDSAFTSFDKLESIIQSTDSRYEIWVEAGTYNIKEAVMISPRVSVFGGFKGSEDKFELRDPVGNKSIFDANGSVQCFKNWGILDGVTIKNGAGKNGGALVNLGGKVTHCIIRDCQSDKGGGIFNLSGAVQNCKVFNNEAKENGGGIYNLSGEVRNCKIYSNKAKENGGGIYSIRSGVTINNLIVGNQALKGGGIYCDNSYVYDSTICYNRATEGGGIFGAYVEPDKCHATSSIITNSIIWNNHPDDFTGWDYSLRFSCSKEGNPQLGNIIVDPKMVKPTLDISNADFSLLSDSPCIYTGNNHPKPEIMKYLYGPSIEIKHSEKDLNDNPRIIGEGIDYGAYESRGKVH